MKVWVTRDKCNTDLNHCCIFYDGTEPIKTKTTFWHCKELGRLIMQKEPKTFKNLFGFTPRKGSRKQYELSLTEIE